MRHHIPSPAEKVIAQARIAAEYHRLGYRNTTEFDANVMVRLMDQLGEMVDELDTAPGPDKGAMVECTTCGASVKFGSCCDECDTPTDH